MRITIMQDDGVVGIDNVWRHVDLTGLAPEIRVVHFDTIKGAGHIEYDRGAMIEVDVRDAEAEAAAELAAGADPIKLAALAPIMKKVSVPRPNQVINLFAPYQVYADRWTAAAPATPQPSPAHDWDSVAKVWVLNDAKQAELDRLALIDGDIQVVTIGSASPKTLAELKAMTRDQYTAWFDQNFDTAAQLVALLKRLLLIVIRRVL